MKTNQTLMLDPATGPVLLPTSTVHGTALPVAGRSYETASAFAAFAAHDSAVLLARTTDVPAPVPRGAPV